MTWSETWLQAQRKRTIHWLVGFMALLATVPLFLAAAGTWLILRIDDPAALAFVGGFFALQVGLLLVAVLVQARRYRGERRILRLVPEHDGMVCPKCRRPLADSGACPRCGREFAAQPVRAYWEQYPLPRAATTGAGLPALPLGARIELAIQRHPWRAAVGIAGVWTACCLLISLTEGSVLVAAIRTFPMLCFMIGMLLVGLSRGEPGGAGEHCARCDYQREPGSQCERCPECGSPWVQRGGLVRDRRNPRKTLLWIGCLLALIYPAAQLWPRLAGRARTKSIAPTWLLFQQVEGHQRIGRSNHDVWADLAARPLDELQSERLTSLLIEEIVAAPRGFVGDEWAALQNRMLAERQQERLFEGLLDKNLRKGYLSPGDRPWLDAAAASGEIPETLLDRYRSEILRPPGNGSAP